MDWSIHRSLEQQVPSSRGVWMACLYSVSISCFAFSPRTEDDPEAKKKASLLISSIYRVVLQRGEKGYLGYLLHFIYPHTYTQSPLYNYIVQYITEYMTVQISVLG